MTKISWTNESWNPATGCTKISAGCKNCYAESIAKRFWNGRKFTDIQIHADRLNKPMHWKKARMIFVNSMSDLFHKDIPFEFAEKVWDVMSDCPQHTFQILTKRADQMLEYANWMPNGRIRRIGYDNVWLGTTVENQITADQRIKHLLKIDADVKFLSVEPLLEQIDISFAFTQKKYFGNITQNTGINWVIIGCESGLKKRPCNIEWIENIVEQCKFANVPVFVKQLNLNGKVEKNINNFPAHLRLQEYPNFY